MHDKADPDPRALLAGISDREERARTAREWGLTDCSSWLTPLICAGKGPEANINAAIVGTDPPDEDGDDDA